MCAACHWAVVEPDDRQVSGHLEAELPSRAQRTERSDVREAQDGGGPGVSREDRERRDDRVVFDVAARLGDGRLEIHVAEGVVPTQHALTLGVRSLGSDREDADVAVAELDHMLGCGTSAASVVDVDARGTGDGLLIDVHERDLAADQPVARAAELGRHE